MTVEIGTKIKHLRELKKITVKEMAQMLNMTEQGYSKIERGQTDPSYKRLLEIADALEEKLENLVSFDPRQFFLQNQITTVNGDVHSNLGDYERKLYEDNNALLKEKIKMQEERIKSQEDTIASLRSKEVS